MVELIVVSVSTAATYFSLQKWIIPQIIAIYKTIQERKHKKDIEIIDVNKEINNMEQQTNNLYENQINFFVGQVDKLQKQLLRKGDEITEMAIQCDELRTELLSIKQQLYEQKKLNMELMTKTCNNDNCPNRTNIKNN